jgi:hypothetical protein
MGGWGATVIKQCPTARDYAGPDRRGATLSEVSSSKCHLGEAVCQISFAKSCRFFS